MKIPASEEEKEALARTLIRQGYGGKLSRMFQELLSLLNPPSETTQIPVPRGADLARVVVDPHSASFFSKPFVKMTDLKIPKLTELGELLLSYWLKERAIVPDSETRSPHRICFMEDDRVMELLGAYSEGFHNSYYYRLGAEVLLHRPHLREKAGL